jgi:hypothetical protein
MSFPSFLIKSLLIVNLIVNVVDEGFSQFVLSNPVENCSTIYINFGVGISTVDFDRDGLDDITICDAPCGVRAFRNLGNGQFAVYYTFPSLNIAKCPTWVDYDNDGDSDFFFTCDNSMIQLYRNDGNQTFLNVTTSLVSTQAFARSMGASWGDYDRDGWLDLYVCNYNFLYEQNWLFHNKGDGTFEEIGEEMGVSNGLRVSFQSTWCDLNMDGWQDLYVVNDLSDVNTFYFNQEGVFVEMSTTYGLDVALNSMSNSISDFDNDGDFDIYISNTSLGNYLMRNDDGYFTNIANDTPLDVNEWSWSGLWIDYDNDSDDDLHISTRGLPNFPAQNPFYRNDEGNLANINLYGLQGDFFESTCAAKGDFNNDGLWDFAVANQAPTSTNVWTNISQVTGNWIKVGLTGTVSNRDGVGSMLRCYHGGEMNVLQTYCGENYMSQDSQYEIIGLANDSLVDSLIVTWPSGWVDRYYNLAINQMYPLLEGETFEVIIDAQQEGVLCDEDDEILLDAGSFLEWTWSTGDTTQVIVVSEPGLYNAAVRNEFGFEATTQIVVALAQSPLLDTWLVNPSCFEYPNGSIGLILQSEENVDIVWSNQQNTSLAEDLPAGLYSVMLTDYLGCQFQSNFTLLQPPLFELEITSTPIDCPGGFSSASGEAIGGTFPYTIHWQGLNPDSLSAGEYIFYATDSLGCISSDTLAVFTPENFEVIDHTQAACYSLSTAIEIEINGASFPYTIEWNVVDTSAVSAGAYNYTITDVHNCLYSGTIEVTEAAEIQITSWVMDAADGDNGAIELYVTGGTPPYTFLWNTGFASNPIADIGQGSYECIISDTMGCLGVTEIISVVDLHISPQNATNYVSVFPNPGNDLIRIVYPSAEIIGNYIVLDSSNRVIDSGNCLDHQLTFNTNYWDKGIYLFRSNGKSIQIVKM